MPVMPIECPECGRQTDSLFASQSTGKVVCSLCLENQHSYAQKPPEPVKIELHPEDIRNQCQ